MYVCVFVCVYVWKVGRDGGGEGTQCFSKAMLHYLSLKENWNKSEVVINDLHNMVYRKVMITSWSLG